jgi:hypothetical protein
MYDVAARDVGLAVAAFALARLAPAHERSGARAPATRPARATA